MDTPNYAYLTGWLQAELRGLCWDLKFEKMSVEARTDYVNKLIEEAHLEAAKYNEMIGN